MARIHSVFGALNILGQYLIYNYSHRIVCWFVDERTLNSSTSLMESQATSSLLWAFAPQTAKITKRSLSRMYQVVQAVQLQVELLLNPVRSFGRIAEL